MNLDEVGDPGDLVVLECAHSVLGVWRNQTLFLHFFQRHVDPTCSHMMITLPIVVVTCKMLNDATST
ncbi:hypothetical protein ZWY2020_012224 [Hordeum vulgare]|nr:hypothetical protein ZWY2020_004085 [Hordeum vulgare]KAI5010087.1 hypothetical protein ZWY2020_012224 [Hordeum vulgare]